MAGEVLCPKCGTVSPTDTRACPKCGTTLGGSGEATSKSKAFAPGAKAPARPVTRKPLAADPGMGAPPDASTLMEHEEKQPPRKPAARPAGPVPQAGAAPRRSNAVNNRAAPTTDALSSSSGRDSLIDHAMPWYLHPGENIAEHPSGVDACSFGPAVRGSGKSAACTPARSICCWVWSCWC